MEAQSCTLSANLADVHLRKLAMHAANETTIQKTAIESANFSEIIILYAQVNG